mmetsp:Transcript_76616/g.127643  ORF Transcript_76616/g.127643 Transcript_76616/m.127643 type:complete len:204 (-) Transcript_76616:401-1012(-)
MGLTSGSPPQGFDGLNSPGLNLRARPPTVVVHLWAFSSAGSVNAWVMGSAMVLGTTGDGKSYFLSSFVISFLSGISNHLRNVGFQTTKFWQTVKNAVVHQNSMIPDGIMLPNPRVKTARKPCIPNLVIIRVWSDEALDWGFLRKPISAAVICSVQLNPGSKKYGSGTVMSVNQNKPPSVMVGSSPISLRAPKKMLIQPMALTA